MILPLDREWFLDFMRRTIRIISVGKKATDRAMQASEHLSSSMQRQAKLTRFLEAKLPTLLPKQVK
jgi:hypothetical protein